MAKRFRFRLETLLKVRQRKLAQIYFRMAHLAIGAAGDVCEGRKYAELRIKARQAAGDYKDKEAKKTDIGLLPKPIRRSKRTKKKEE